MEDNSKPWVFVHGDGSETRVSDAAGYEEWGWTYAPEDEFWTGCTEDCPDDCSADHKGEQ